MYLMTNNYFPQFLEQTINKMRDNYKKNHTNENNEHDCHTSPEDGCQACLEREEYE